MDPLWRVKQEGDSNAVLAFFKGWLSVEKRTIYLEALNSGAHLGDTIDVEDLTHEGRVQRKKLVSTNSFLAKDLALLLQHINQTLGMQIQQACIMKFQKETDFVDVTTDGETERFFLGETIEENLEEYFSPQGNGVYLFLGSEGMNFEILRSGDREETLSSYDGSLMIIQKDVSKEFGIRISTENDSKGNNAPEEDFLEEWQSPGSTYVVAFTEGTGGTEGSSK